MRRSNAYLCDVVSSLLLEKMFDQRAIERLGLLSHCVCHFVVSVLTEPLHTRNTLVYPYQNEEEDSHLELISDLGEVR